ncbi:MAG TPA: hydrogenase maturation nickel metallochaperone HypA [Chloroflexi bacterium]|nr:MAG: hydrogenase maturation nickel metallochaperone HypA [Anaerolineaceae bacterium 4572_5.2]HEY85420.1 hydrogenase maturation nickel metallochaperone HypA [Chloroflexota bacterium]
MHELPVTQGILSVVLETAQKHNAQRIDSIDLVIGDLSSFVDDSIQFYFDILSQDTIAQGAKLNFQREAAAVICLECGHRFNAAPPLSPFCPACDSSRLQVSGGKDFYIDSIEIG